MQTKFPLCLTEDQNLMMGSTVVARTWPQIVENLGRTYVFYKAVPLKQNMIGLFRECAIYEEFIPDHEDVSEFDLDTNIDVQTAPTIDLVELNKIIEEAGFRGMREAIQSPEETRLVVRNARTAAMKKYFEDNGIQYKV